MRREATKLAVIGIVFSRPRRPKHNEFITLLFNQRSRGVGAEVCCLARRRGLPEMPLPIAKTSNKVPHQPFREAKDKASEGAGEAVAFPQRCAGDGAEQQAGGSQRRDFDLTDGIAEDADV